MFDKHCKKCWLNRLQSASTIKVANFCANIGKASLSKFVQGIYMKSTLSFQSSNLMVLCGSSFPNESCFLMKDCFVRVHDFFNSMWFLVSKLIVWLLGIDIFMKCNFSRFTDESFSDAIFKDNFDSEFQHWLHRSFETEHTSDPRFNCRVSKRNWLGKYIFANF